MRSGNKGSGCELAMPAQTYWHSLLIGPGRKEGLEPPN